jgi:glycosyltransferase involved in cell wall biosynthesis
MKNSVVSVIVPCYNQAQYLSECLGSVLNQTYENWECIIVNDGSLDNTEEVAKKWCTIDKRYKYINKENEGIVEARNSGILNSEGDYILPLDADDKIASSYLFEAIKCFEDKPQIKIVYALAEYFGEKSGNWELAPYKPEEILFYNMIYCSAIYRRSDYDKTRGYNKNMGGGLEDWDFWLSLLETGGEVFQLPQTLFYYRVKELSRTTNIDDKKQKLLYRQIYMNHPNLYAKYFSDPISLYLNFKQFENENKALKSSMDYKLGSFILKPLRFVKRVLKHGNLI